MCRMAGRTRSQLIGSSFPTYFVERDLASDGVRLTFKEGAVTNYVLNLPADPEAADEIARHRRED